MANLDLTGGTLNVTAAQGKTWAFRLAFPAGTNLTGYDCHWAMADTPGGTAILSAGTGTGITMGGTAGYIDFEIASTATAGAAVGSYIHEFELTEPGGDKPGFIRGTWNVVWEAVTS